MANQQFETWRPKAQPWVPPDYDDHVIYAVRALAEGRANEGQQRLLMHWIRYATGVDDLSFRPGEEGARDTAFAEGKRFVGLQINKMLSPMLTPARPLHAPDPEPDPKPRRARGPAKIVKPKRGRRKTNG